MSGAAELPWLVWNEGMRAGEMDRWVTRVAPLSCMTWGEYMREGDDDLMSGLGGDGYGFTASKLDWDFDPGTMLPGSVGALL